MSTEVLQSIMSNWGIGVPSGPVAAMALDAAPAESPELGATVVAAESTANGAPESNTAAEAEPTPDNAPELDATAAAGPAPDNAVLEFSNEWFGLTVAGRKSADVARDVQRLKELMRLYPIRPHLHQAGGSGFSSSPEEGWHPDPDAIIREFSRLWFTVAGDHIIAEYGHLMHTIPTPEPGTPPAPVRFRPWKSADDEPPHPATLSTHNTPTGSV